MKTLPIDASNTDRLLDRLAATNLFRALAREQLAQVLKAAELVLWPAGETIVKQGDPSDFFAILLGGEASVRMEKGPEDAVEIGRLPAPETIGEVSLLLGHPRSATILALDSVEALRFTQAAFQQMLQKVPGFGLQLCQGLAFRLEQVSAQVPLPHWDPDESDPDDATLALLPEPFQARHRAVPLRFEANVLTVGVVEDPSRALVTAIRQQLPGVTVRTVRVRANTLERLLRGGEEKADSGAKTEWPESKSPRLDALLERVVGEGASDLHLQAGCRPFWRIDGDLLEIKDSPVIGAEEAVELVAPLLSDRHVQEFDHNHDTDFAYAMRDQARFRINLFRESNGAGAVFRLIPYRIMNLEALGLPPVVKSFCELPRGLVLVTGPTGAGKSTTLAAMIDLVNRTRNSHIVTLEDPIEYVHKSDKCLVTQREVGGHTTSFARALRAALREDPDVLLVGELRDRETVALTLELANTGHLVFATVHTSSAAASVERIVDFFPTDEHSTVRSRLADCLRGVVSQTLLRKSDGGRVGAFEILVNNTAVANLIREGKTMQIPNLMQTGAGAGNQLLNEDLAKLVRERKVAREDALAKSPDRADLERRLGAK